MVSFADEATIEVSSGKGGNGCIAFRREKYVPNGGPSGGDGGRGGDIIFEIRNNLRTLVHLRYKRHFKAQSGGDGMGSKMFGKDGEDCIIPLPPGTLIRDVETGEIIKDFGIDARQGEEGRFTFLKGGNGGWGNVHFKSSTNQAPRTALPGKPGEVRRIKVELNIIADIGFVGFPNAGKSSLLDYFTNARPKIAPYPFTTKIPNLGVLRVDDEQDIILADIPGIIEGASEGVGLGIRFLKHISRTAGLAFFIDLGEENCLNSYETLLEELSQFSQDLMDKPRIILANKLDLPEARERLVELKAKHSDLTIYGISIHNRWGLDEVKVAFIDLVREAEIERATAAQDGLRLEGAFLGEGAIDTLLDAGEPHFMHAELEDFEYPEIEEGDFGATISLNRKKRRRK